MLFSEDQRIEQLKFGVHYPKNYSAHAVQDFTITTLTTKELEEVQLAFQQTGIDAIIYFEIDKLFASKDVTKAFGDYLAEARNSQFDFY